MANLDQQKETKKEKISAGPLAATKGCPKGRFQFSLRALIELTAVADFWLWIVSLVWPSKTPTAEKGRALAVLGAAFVWLWAILTRRR
jgi:hypothetical protein